MRRLQRHLFVGKEKIDGEAYALGKIFNLNETGLF